MSRILVTGAAGFIGHYVASRLIREGHQVIGLGHGAPPEGLTLSDWQGTGVDLANLFDYADDVEVIYHCAGSGSVAISLKDPVHDFNNNVLTTRAVLEFARRQGRSKVVLLSSAGVYGVAKQMPIRVGDPLNPISPYGANKVICEILVQQYARNFSVPAVITRLFSVYGEGLRKQLLWDASRKLMQKDTSFFGTGSETRDWIHVEDAAALIVAASSIASSDAPIINGGTGRAVPIRDIIENLAHHLGCYEAITFNGQVRPGDPQHYEADITGALATGWQPRIDLSNGLSRYAAWFQGE